jgi:hypothetical protein
VIRGEGEDGRPTTSRGGASVCRRRTMFLHCMSGWDRRGGLWWCAGTWGLTAGSHDGDGTGWMGMDEG